MTASAHAVVTCQGKEATIVAAPGQETVGTSGDDVIVGGASFITALAGNDTICLDSGSVTAGDGNDSVLVTGTEPGLTASANLGAGDDRYVGVPGQDSVDYDYYSPGVDVVSTGAGLDTVSSRGPDEPNHDVVDLGAGDDVLNVDLTAGSSAQVRAGVGSDSWTSAATLPSMSSTSGRVS